LHFLQILQTNYLFCPEKSLAKMSNTPKTISLLAPSIQNYAWGGTSFIPDLLEMTNLENAPFAELWMGTHAKSPSYLITQKDKINLRTYIKENPISTLGETIFQKFTELPYLFKVLDVQQMLSIQVHPSKKQAQLGFERENQAQIPLDAPHRNYRDRNHKPELMVALTDFWLLHGFRVVSEITHFLKTIPEFECLQPHFKTQNLRELYQFVMELSQNQVNNVLRPFAKRLIQSSFSEHQPEYWAKRALEDFALPNGDLDRGIFSIFFLNLVHIPKGKGIYQPEGILHSYLRGTNIEIMANSDNVLRGGLTPKHMDIPELLANTKFDSIIPQILDNKEISEFEFCYPTPAQEFKLTKICLSNQQVYQHTSDSPEILIILEGKLIIKCEEIRIELKKGQVIFVSAFQNYTIRSLVPSSLFRASVP